MMSPTRDFIFQIFFSRPYIEMQSSAQNIALPVFELLNTLKGEITYHNEKPYQTHSKYLNTGMNLPQSVLYTPLFHHLYRAMMSLFTYTSTMWGEKMQKKQIVGPKMLFFGPKSNFFQTLSKIFVTIMTGHLKDNIFVLIPLHGGPRGGPRGQFLGQKSAFFYATPI